MLEWIASLFQGAVAELMFFSICIAGSAFTVISLIFGGDHGDMHGDFHGGDLHHGDLHHDDAHTDEGPRFFSIRGLSLFGTGFGAVGYIVQHYTGKTLLAATAGLVSGVVLAMLGLAFIRLFFRQQVSSVTKSSDVIGATGTVLTSIQSDSRAGEVLLTLVNTQVTRAAIGEGGKPIPQGAAVRVVRLAGNTVVVEKLS